MDEKLFWIYKKYILQQTAEAADINLESDSNQSCFYCKHMGLDTLI